ncbi:glycosyl hydrolase family 28 protein [Saccharibacillus sp. CPCC 101409]|uniref:glycosyl hydrolase family 28 protein n=1 Tax=Saccharibacillus sp. CPCC 101409 TaxID=3058041 RepID=UPI0026726A67|nr:glycosyl hydrolase family 28 protein [Saccharibacillus sp. CPCC 101409]MDO3411925.1 glycosyl hydrolase family 28 protein [Saccharibacillus sp. CPCC 101409]
MSGGEYGQVSTLAVYPIPEGLEESPDYTVRVREPGAEWQQLFVYRAAVDMHDVRYASMVTFSCGGPVELEIEHRLGAVTDTVVRPLSAGLRCDDQEDEVALRLKLDGPRLLSLEVNGERFRNLHIFANPAEENAPEPDGDGVLTLRPGLHRGADIRQRLDNGSRTDADTGKARTAEQRRIVRFEPGVHLLEDDRLYLPSHTSVYLAGGAVLCGGLVCDKVRGVEIRGRGVLDLSSFAKNTYYRGVDVRYSSDIVIEGIAMIDPPHYSVLLGQSERIRISNLKTFSSRGWCDGIDMMACRDVTIEGGFLRTSDDCIAVYASRGEFCGDARDISVRGTILWADVAHPINIGTHGDHAGAGTVIERLHFGKLDILEHHEPQPDYWGCMAINAGDHNIVRDVVFEDIRVETFELGEPFNIRVLKNEKYNPAPGRRIERVLFRNIRFDAACPNPSHISGYDEDRMVEDVAFENVTLGDEVLTSEARHLLIGEYTREIAVQWR